MTAPERRRPLPALAFIGALSLLTALVWFRVLHRTDGNAVPPTPTHSTCASPSASATAAPTVLPVPAKVSVVVLNSTDRNGIAGSTSKALKKDGFATGKAADDSSSYGGHGLIKGVGEIRYAPNQLPSATLLSYYFPRAKLTATDSSSRTVLVALGAKFKKVATKHQVHHALARDQVTLKHARVRVHAGQSNKKC